MAKKAWAKFPHANKSFDYAGDKLEKNWSSLHTGDCEPFPDAAHVAALLKKHPKLGKAGDAGKIADQIQDAWRSYHAGDFQAAYEAGSALGPLGASVAIKAAGIHTVYLLDDEKEATKRWEDLAKQAEEAIAALPDQINAHYRHAFALGRYSQSISVAKALSMGLAGKVKVSLDKTLKLAPKHAEAHSALGVYHAEIINKVGAMIGGLTYGAKASTGEEMLNKAIKLEPKAPIAYVELANGLILLYGDKREDDAAEAFDKAAKLKPRDAMEKLDAEFAKAQLE
jgi:tetratricopeptide (TPR) repeat protein